MKMVTFGFLRISKFSYFDFSEKQEFESITRKISNFDLIFTKFLRTVKTLLSMHFDRSPAQDRQQRYDNVLRD